MKRLMILASLVVAATATGCQCLPELPTGLFCSDCLVNSVDTFQALIDFVRNLGLMA